MMSLSIVNSSFQDSNEPVCMEYPAINARGSKVVVSWTIVDKWHSSERKITKSMSCE